MSCDFTKSRFDAHGARFSSRDLYQDGTTACTILDQALYQNGTTPLSSELRAFHNFRGESGTVTRHVGSGREATAALNWQLSSEGGRLRTPGTGQEDGRCGNSSLSATRGMNRKAVPMSQRLLAVVISVVLSRTLLAAEDPALPPSKLDPVPKPIASDPSVKLDYDIRRDSHTFDQA